MMLFNLRLCSVYRFRLFIFFTLIVLVTIYLRTANKSNVSPRTTTSLIARQVVLVPVPINELYNYRVVCSGTDGILNQSHLVTQFQTRCQSLLNQTVQIEFHPPSDFQLRSSSTEKYRRQWKNNDRPCSLFSNETVAIIISYRDREENLRVLLFNLIPFLERQKISYRIFLIEQIATGPFNKGRLYNIAHAHLMKTYKPSCVIFHDVDLIPENQWNFYSCSSGIDRPIHMSSQVRLQPTGSYTNIYQFLVGGVLNIRPIHFAQLNGFSNRYFNWGGEDDDIGLRFLAKDICVQRPTTGFYLATSHAPQTRNPQRFQLLFDAVLQQDSDGLSNIEELAEIVQIIDYPLLTWIKVRWIK